MKLGPVGRERDTLAIGRDHAPPLTSRQGVIGLVDAGLSRVVILDDIEKGLKARLHAGVGGVGVDFEDQVRLRSQLGGLTMRE